MKAAYDLIEPLTRHFDFNIISETRSGLPSFPPNLQPGQGTPGFWRLHPALHGAGHPACGDPFPRRTTRPAPTTSSSRARLSSRSVGTSPRAACPTSGLTRSWRPASWNYSRARCTTCCTWPCWAATRAGHGGEFLGLGQRRRQKTTRAATSRPCCSTCATKDNYASGDCGLISPDTLDLALQIGLFQAPHITVIDRRYELSGACRTHVVDGMCRCR